MVSCSNPNTLAIAACKVRKVYELGLSGKVSWDQLVMSVNRIQQGNKDLCLLAVSGIFFQAHCH